MNYLVAYIIVFELLSLRSGKSLMLHSAGGGVVSTEPNLQENLSLALRRESHVAIRTTFDLSKTQARVCLRMKIEKRKAKMMFVFSEKALEKSCFSTCLTLRSCCCPWTLSSCCAMRTFPNPRVNPFLMNCAASSSLCSHRLFAMASLLFMKPNPGLLCGGELHMGREFQSNFHTAKLITDKFSSCSIRT